MAGESSSSCSWRIHRDHIKPFPSSPGALILSLNMALCSMASSLLPGPVYCIPLIILGTPLNQPPDDS